MFPNYVRQRIVSIFHFKHVSIKQFIKNKFSSESQTNSVASLIPNDGSKKVDKFDTLDLKGLNIWQEEKQKLSTKDLNYVLEYINNPTFLGVTSLFVYLTCNSIGVLAYAIGSIPIILNIGNIATAITTFKRDITCDFKHFKARAINRILALKNVSVFECFEAVANVRDKNPMIYYEDTEWSFHQIEILSNKIFNYFILNKYERGDVVALMVSNRPELIALILGLAKNGIIIALIDLKYKGDILLQALEISDCKSIIVSNDVSNQLDEIKDKLSSDKQIMYLDEVDNNLNAQLTSVCSDPIDTVHKIGYNDPLFYFYSVDHDGSVKAAVMTHAKFIKTSLECAYELDLNNDIIYNPLRLQNPIGLVVGIGGSILCGIPTAMKYECSPTTFWSDCIKYGCTVALYDHNIAFHLTKEETTSEEKEHKVRKVIGTGMTSSNWKVFKHRFNVDVTELHGVTEYNCAMKNTDGKVGAIGFIRSYLPQRNYLIAMDPLTLSPIRNESGFCIKSNAGLLIEMVPKKDKHKYIDSTSTNVVMNVFKENDVGVLTGDILTMDEEGYLYNIDNLDSFYWKDELVVSNDVESIIQKLTKHPYCSVFGVTIPYIKGRAGMVIFNDPQNVIDAQQLGSQLVENLSDSARPVFLRITNRSTEEMKAFKDVYACEGYNPVKVKDNLYYFNTDTYCYEIMTNDVYNKILEQKIKF